MRRAGEQQKARVLLVDACVWLRKPLTKHSWDDTWENFVGDGSPARWWMGAARRSPPKDVRDEVVLQLAFDNALAQLDESS